MTATDIAAPTGEGISAATNGKSFPPTHEGNPAPAFGKSFPSTRKGTSSPASTESFPPTHGSATKSAGTPETAVSPFPAIGDMPMPTGFRYRKIYERGKPQHERTDDFRIRHPSMAISKRAKIFAPFDALKGFNEAVSAKNELYESRRTLSEEELTELNSKMTALLRLVNGGRKAERKQVRVTVTYFVPCTDINNEAYGVKGQYHTVTGTCTKVDPDRSRSILVDNRRICFCDICEVEF